MSEQSNSNAEKQDERLNAAFDELEKGVEPAAPRSSSGLGSSLAVFLALIAIGIASYPAYEIYRQKTGGDEQAAALDARLSEITAQHEATLDNLSAITIRVDEAAARLDGIEVSTGEFRQYVTGELDNVRSSLGTSSQDWLYAEVEYLVRMANQRALMEGDAVSALSLLQSADQIVRQAEGLTAHALRESLAADIAALKAVNQVDVEGIYLELSALIAQVAHLERTVPRFEPAPEEEPTVAEPQSGFDRVSSLVSDAGERFTGLVDFRRGGVTVTPILPPKEEYYLRQNLILKLQMAQMALLEANDEVFKTSIEEASTWVAESFDKDDAATIAMLAALSTLQQKDVGVIMPDISRSLQAARTQLVDFHQAGDQ